MSIMIVSEWTMGIIEAGLRKFEKRRGVITFLTQMGMDPKLLVKKMYCLNVSSYNQNYGMKVSSRIQIPTMPENEVNFGMFVKSFCCWAYQIEGKPEKSPLGRVAIMFANCLADEIERLVGTKDYMNYENAKWD